LDVGLTIILGNFGRFSAYLGVIDAVFLKCFLSPHQNIQKHKKRLIQRKINSQKIMKWLINRNSKQALDFKLCCLTPTCFFPMQEKRRHLMMTTE
jgi:hypothetical protein